MQYVDDLVVRIRRVVGADSEVLLAYLFGSQSKGKATEHSDVDIAILHCSDSSMKVGELQEKVAEELGLNEDNVDVVDISRAPIPLKINIVRGPKLVDRGNYERRLIEELTKFPAARVMKDSSMIIDSSIIDFLYSRLRKATEESAYLREEILMKGAEAVVTDGTLRRAMARSVHELIEMMFDTCRHLVSVKALGVAETYVDFPRLLSRHNLMPLSLAEALEETARLRDLLVHECVELDHHRLFGRAHEIVEYMTPKFEEWVLGLLRQIK